MLTAAAADRRGDTCPAQPSLTALDTPPAPILPLLRGWNQDHSPHSSFSRQVQEWTRHPQKVTQSSELKTTPSWGWVFELRIV